MDYRDTTYKADLYEAMRWRKIEYYGSAVIVVGCICFMVGLYIALLIWG